MSATEKSPYPLSMSVVVPVFNSTPTLPELVRRLEAVLSDGYERFELVLVNDGSSDESWKAICELREEHDWIRGINLMRNYGQHSALMAGIRVARGAVIVTLDDDLQNPPEEIPRLVDCLGESCDLAYGVPRKKRQGIWRNIGSRVTRLALRSSLGAELAGAVSPFRAFRAEIASSLAGYSAPFVMIDVLLSWATERFSAVSVEHHPRTRGRSNYTVRRLIFQAMNLFTGFSIFPLRIVSIIGFVFALFGLAVLIYVFITYLIHGGAVPGFSFLASIIAIFSGAQLLALGIIGEYLSRVHSRSMGRPTYVVREDLDCRRCSHESESRDR